MVFVFIFILYRFLGAIRNKYFKNSVTNYLSNNKFIVFLIIWEIERFLNMENIFLNYNII